MNQFFIIYLHMFLYICLGFPGGSDGKEPTCNAGDPGLIPGFWKIPWRRELLPNSSILAWEISWTEEPGGLQSMESQRVDTTE